METKYVVKDVAKVIKTATTKYSPALLTGMGIGGMFTSTILAVKATPTAVYILDDEKKQRGLTKEDKLPAKEIVSLTWKGYIPSVVVGGLSAACILGSNEISNRRHAAIATAYTLSETAFNEYKDQVIETIGEKKNKNINSKIAKQKIDKDPIESKEIIVIGSGETIFYDSLANRYFKSDMATVKNAINELNYQMQMEGYVSLNDLYESLGLNSCDLGDMLGWCYETGLLDVDFEAQKTEDDKACLVMIVNNLPKPEFNYFGE